MGIFSIGSGGEARIQPSGTLSIEGSGMLSIPSGNLLVWLNAGAESYGNGAAVNLWTDQSGNGNHARQVLINNQPTFATSAINGQPAISFPGTQAPTSDLKYLELETTTFDPYNVVTTDLTYFLVMQVNNDPAIGNEFGAWNFTDSLANVQTLHPFTNNTIFHEFGTVGRQQLSPNTTGNLTSPHIVFGTHTDNVGTITHEGRIYQASSIAHSFAPLGGVAQSFARSTGNPTKPTALIGASELAIRAPGSDWPMNGFIAEIIIYDKLLTGGEFTTIRNYLNGKYGALIP